MADGRQCIYPPGRLPIPWPHLKVFGWAAERLQEMPNLIDRTVTALMDEGVPPDDPAAGAEPGCP